MQPIQNQRESILTRLVNAHCVLVSQVKSLQTPIMRWLPKDKNSQAIILVM